MAAGGATLVVSLIWDITKRSRGQITAIEQRKSLASSGGGAAGGILGGIGAALGVAALVSNPAGWVVGAIGLAGGVAGGIGGSIGGSALDSAIWDETEDSAMHIYEYFGHDVSRGTRPVYS